MPTSTFCLKPEVFRNNYLYHDLEFQDRPPRIQTGAPQRGEDIKEHLLRACKELTPENATQFQEKNFLNKANWMVSRKFKLVSCTVHKAGSTNIGRTLFTLENLEKYSDANKVRTGSARYGVNYQKKFKNETDFETEFKSYTKFMFVRDPIERLLSAYRANLPHGMFRNQTYTVKAFLEKVLETPDQSINEHLRSFSRDCNPCKLNLDFIGTTENFNEDMNKILKSVGADIYCKLPERNQTGYTNRQSSEAMQDYLKEIPKSMLRKLYEKYYWDYFLFGFRKPHF